MKSKDKNKKDKPTLDTETTFADMNVEGFRWYDPTKKNGNNNNNRIRLTKKEYRNMIKGALSAIWPYMLCTVIAFALMVLIGYLWLM